MSERSYDGAKTFFPFRSYDPSHNRRTHWAISRSNQFSTPGITEAMLYAVLFYLTTHTTQVIYGQMASDIQLRTTYM